MTSLYRGSRKKTTEMFKEELKALGSNVIILGEYTKARSKIACLCPDCNYLWDTTPNRMLSAGSGCPKCGGRILLSDGNTEIFTHDVLQMDHLGGRL